MKKTLLLLVIFLGIFLLGCKSNEVEIVYPSWIDTYKSFYDGRFQVWRVSEKKILSDEKNKGITLVGDVEIYIEEPPYIYIKGPYYSSVGITSEGREIYSYADPETGEEKELDEKESVLNYTVINYETGEIDVYQSPNDFPEHLNKEVFQDIDFFCQFILFDRTCYKKD